MEVWHDVLNSALLGTDKRQPATDGLPAELSEAVVLTMQGKAIDKEEQFLQMAALAFNYRQCGVSPLKKEGVSIDKARAEENPYCSTFSMQVLKDILDAESIPLLTLWLQACASKKQVMEPDLLPTVLSLGVQYKKLQPLLGSCCGKRGAWLSRLNKEWNFSIAATDEEVWQTGTPEQRKVVLQQLRAVNPSQAREWLQQTWAAEDANTKVSLLELLVSNIGEEDVVFLESLSSEKSKKVKEVALKLLKKVPSSAIVQQYQQMLQQAVTLKKEKSLLGMVSKTSLVIALSPEIDESIFKTGIDKLSNNKAFTDEEFVLFQLAQVVPPLFWEQQLNGEPGAIIELLQKDVTGKKLLPALVHSVMGSGSQMWALAFMKHSEVFYLDILPLLPVEQQEHYSEKFFDQHADSIISYAVRRTDEWSLALTQHIFQHTARNPYQYNRQFYNQHVERFPTAIAAELDKYQPAEEHYKTMWSNTSAYVVKLMGLKKQVFDSFNALK